jgi:polar amino acid transport system substrate-binding protein
VKHHLKTAFTAAALLVAVMVVAAGCGSSSSDSSSSAPSTSTAAAGSDPAIVAMLPSNLQSGGSLTVATDASYAPNEYFDTDNTTIIGMDIDLGHAIGKLQGVDWNFVNAGFDSIIPGLASGKYDVGMSSFSDNAEREKVVDFVTYFQAGTSFYINKDAAPINGGLEALCGRKVAVEKGTTQLADLTAQTAKCTANGKPAIQISGFPDQNEANLAITSGRADIGMADSPVAAYIVDQSNGALKLSGTPYGVVPYGIAIPKDQKELTNATLAAVKKLIANGTYMQILKKWGVQAGAITTPVINGAVD